MATSIDYIEFVCEQIRGTGDIRYKKMFGEYMVYVNDRPLLLICDSTVYIKKREEISTLMQDADIGIPYKGSKEHYILDVEDVEHSYAVINVLKEIVPIPKSKKNIIK